MMILRCLLLIVVSLMLALTGNGKDNCIKKADSLLSEATAEYNISFRRAAALAAAAEQFSSTCSYSRGKAIAVGITSRVQSNTNQCHQALMALHAQLNAGPSPYIFAVHAALGACWFSQGNNDSALHYHKLAVAGWPADDCQSSRYARQCLALGRVYVKLAMRERAVECYDKAIKTIGRTADKEVLALSEDLLGEIFYLQRLYEKSLQHFQQSYRALHAFNDLEGQATALLHAGNAWFMQARDDSALACYTLALAHLTTVGDSLGMAICYSNLSRIYLEARNTAKALSYAHMALSAVQPGIYFTQEAATYQHLGDIYGEQKEYTKAAACLEKALAAARITDNKVILRDCYKSLSELYSYMQDPKMAMKYLLIAYRLRDTIAPLAFGHQLAETEAKYKAEKKEAEIRGLKQQSLISSLKVQQQRNRLQMQGYLLLLLIVVIVASVAITYIRRSKRKLVEQLRKENLIRETEERERSRISKDIHDELGSGLSKILYLSEWKQTDGTPGHIAETARGLIGNMKDLIWAMNPDNTTLSSLAAHIREYASDYLEDMPIALKVDIPHSIPDIPLSKEATRNLFMILKEALQNTVKYAAAANVHITLSINDVFRLEIRDDGTGFDTHRLRQGNGLRNMQVRASALKATITINSSPGHGTATIIEMPITALSSHAHAFASTASHHSAN